MRTWVKVTLAGVAAAVLGFSLLAGTGAYFVFRHLQTSKAAEADTQRDFDAVRARFGSRPPLIEVIDVKKGDIKITRATHPEGRRAETVYVLTWNADEGGRVLRTDVPLWLMRFSSVNVLSHLGIAPERYRLTVEDLKRFGPGIVVDFKQEGRAQVLIWLE